MNDYGLVNRRSVLTQVVPAAAFAGLGLIAGNAFAAGKAPADKPAASASPGDGAVVRKLVAQACQNGAYQLPPLPYGYDALEPHISSPIMRIHHDRHHRGYVNGLNQTLQKLAALRESENIDMDRLLGLEKALSFNTGGHVLHTFFWATMSPNAGGTPKGDIADAIHTQFNSFDTFKTYFSKVAGGVKGSGWALLGYEPIGDQLMVLQVNDHDLKLGPGIQPLLPLDVWEHAYYLQYQSNRGAFIDAWWNVVNWPAVDHAYRWIRSRFRERTA